MNPALKAQAKSSSVGVSPARSIPLQYSFAHAFARITLSSSFIPPPQPSARPGRWRGGLSCRSPSLAERVYKTTGCRRIRAHARAWIVPFSLLPPTPRRCPWNTAGAKTHGHQTPEVGWCLGEGVSISRPGAQSSPSPSRSARRVLCLLPCPTHSAPPAIPPPDLT